VIYPAADSHVLAIGASTDRDFRSDYSCYGSALAFVAPSSGGWHDIVTTDRTGSDGYSDTDYAVDSAGPRRPRRWLPGIGALVLSVNPDLGIDDVKAVMTKSCDKIGGVTYGSDGRNQYYGYGRINAYKAVSNAMASLVASMTASPEPAAQGTPLTCSVRILNRDHHRLMALCSGTHCRPGRPS